MRIVCGDCGWNVRCVDQKARTFACYNPACAKYGQTMRVSVESADVAAEKAVITEYFEQTLP